MQGNTEGIEEGVEVWVDLEKLDGVLSFPYKLATVSSVDTAKNMADVTYTNGVKEKVKLDRLTRVLNKDTINVDDMAQVTSINKVDLLNNIKNRFDSGEIFTNVGKTLIIVNPYQMLPGVFTEENENLFIEASKAKTIMGFSKHMKTPPHIYEVGMDTISQLLEYRKPQAIVISGESGAGKTETAKQAMKFVTYYFAKEGVSGISGSAEEVSLETKILACNPVLEAFGNAKTVRNDNSSRFGKYIKIFVDLDKQCIIGAYMITYLLEKSRVCKISKGERNYHIFYQMIKGIKCIVENKFDYEVVYKNVDRLGNMVNNNDKLKNFITKILNKEFLVDRLALYNEKNEMKMDCENFDYLRNDVYQIPKVDDAFNFFETIEGMINTGFNFEEIVKVLEVAAGVLLLGNIEFVDNSADTTKPCLLTDIGEFYLEKGCGLLQLDKNILKEAFTINIRVIRNEVLKTPLKLNDCKTFRDTFTKEMFNRTFNYLVKKMNNSLFDEKIASQVEHSPSICHIGLLDIFGFECFEFNSLEQFCINYANERLQQLYISDIFKETERLFEAEGLKEYYGKINFVDNSVILEVMDKYPSGIFFLLDNECNVTAEDKNFISKILNSYKTHTHLKKSKFGPERFLINHTAKDVDYNTTGFTQKNLDEFKIGMKNAMESVKNVLITEICNPKEETFGKKVEKFLGGKFRVDMNNLIDELVRCSCHYVRCLKPNEEKRPKYFLSNFAMQQIKYMGVLDTIRIRKEGFPVKLTHHEFYVRYEDVIDFPDKPFVNDVKHDNPKIPEYIKLIMKEIYPQHSTDRILFGKTCVLMKQNFYDLLDKLRAKLIEEKERVVTKIAMKFRGRKYYQLFQKLRKMVVWAQRRFKVLKNIQYIQRLRHCSKKIQRWFYRKKFLKAHEECCRRLKIVKAFFKRKSFRVKLTSLFRKILFLKAMLKRFIKKRKLIRKKRIINMIRNMVLDITSKAFDNYIRLLYGKSMMILQPNIRSYLAKKRMGKTYLEAKAKIKNLRLTRATLKIQTHYRMFIMRRYKKMVKYLTDKIIGRFKIVKIQSYIRKLRKNSTIIKGAFLTFYYRKKILNERIEEFNEVEDNLYSENNFINLITLFPNYKYKTNNQRGSTAFTLNKVKDLQKYYEKKLRNQQPQIYFQASHLKLSPFDEPKLHFFAHILDMDVVCNTDEIYDTLWSETAQEVLKFSVNNNTPIQQIEIGNMHSAMVNSSGKVFVWGWNGKGQCGFKPNRDKEFKFDYEKINKKDNELQLNVCYGSLKKSKKLENFDLDLEIELLKQSDSHVNELVVNLNPNLKRSQLWDFYNISKPIIIDNFACRNIVTGEDFTMIITKEYKLYVFGSNESHQFGMKDKKILYDPVNYNDYIKILCKNNELAVQDVMNLNITQAKTSGKMNIILTEKGELILLSHFGKNQSLVKMPKSIKIPDVKFMAVECGKNFCVLLASTGLLYSFGENTYGQLGQGDFRTRTFPEEIFKFKEFGVKTVQFSCGIKHTVIRSSTGRAFTWGSNSQGQLGNKTYVDSPFPVMIEIPINDMKANFIQVSAGLRSTAFLTDNRQIFTCGSAGDISKQNSLVEFDYKAKLPELFSYDNHQIIKIHHTWNSSMSVMYAIIAETTPLKIKLNNPQKMKFILNSLSNKWVNKDIFPPKIDTIENFIAAKHLVKNITTNNPTKKTKK